MKDETAGAGKCPFGFGGEARPVTVSTPKPAGAGSAAVAEADGYRHLSTAPGTARDKLPDLLRDPVPEGENGLATGRCLCGKVSFRSNQPFSMVFASHDAVSRKRSGGVALTIMLRAGSTAFAGWDNLVHYQVSEREVSCFCSTCGTPVLTRYLAPDVMSGMISLSAGLLDRTGGLRLAADISHDEKPDFYAFEGERRVINTAELEAMFAGRGR
ncbi:GFA family protein [Pseudogemmobacter bohemicus]|uniref:GFA family protein n=1 Tax=Pseudogemmobacter bohemicus TaxID=2250708 RepID=UPI000DD42F7D|nr:hypothetical protein [Pseudogemmobacter bohemicus]